jgi:hypothetical protein
MDSEYYADQRAKLENSEKMSIEASETPVFIINLIKE